ncbi:ALA-interacting subunit 3 [Selaginella moellendorffii]|uniref:ALA-interacting subunit 3 n=1 Tax=Selaginella moellendorffii TaxID=88036 RepID=UPI000D1C309C|nr:ALA-interacting subunit 3 [Selaginella moellendorffii]|eukprot:XP_002974651.2 ALA-interacting subunit 3 [Selaginella moellendorffii]
MEVVSSSESPTSSASTSTAATASLPSSLKSRRPKYSRFTQQELPACKPMLTTGWVISIFMAVGVLFIPLGACALNSSKKVVEIVDQYETVCIPSAGTKEARVQYIQDISTAKACTRQLLVTKNMAQPIYVYYELHNFFQNHRRYVKSRSDQQLLYGNASESSMANCDPQRLLAGKPIVPCGLIAWSLFNDTYSFKLNSVALAINRKGIAWDSDRKDKFGGSVYPSNFPNNYPAATNGSIIGGASLDPNTPLNANEDLIVWMRTAALPVFRKLWGKIERDLYAGDLITVDINNVYNVYSFHGKKKLVLATTSWLGGKNHFLGIAYLVVGGLSIAMAMVFVGIQIKCPRPLGDPSYLSWNKNKGRDLNTSPATGVHFEERSLATGN